jgi:hypothetical protein
MRGKVHRQWNDKRGNDKRINGQWSEETENDNKKTISHRERIITTNK